MRKAIVAILLSTLFAMWAGVAAANVPEPNPNQVEFWCAVGGQKFDPASTPFVVPAPPIGTIWTLLVLKAGDENSTPIVNEVFLFPTPGQSYSRTDGKSISHAILCFGPIPTTTTEDRGGECQINCGTTTQPTTPSTTTPTTSSTSSTTMATTTTSSTTTSSSTTTTCPDCSPTQQSLPPGTTTTAPTTTQAPCLTCRNVEPPTSPTTLPPATTAPSRAAVSPSDSFATTTAPAVTNPASRAAAPPPADEQLPTTGAADSLYWMALGGTLAIMVGLVLVARMAPRRR